MCVRRHAPTQSSVSGQASPPRMRQRTLLGAVQALPNYNLQRKGRSTTGKTEEWHASGCVYPGV